MHETLELPDVLYLHGFASSPGSAKARAFAEHLERFGGRLAIPRLDGGDFAHLTLTGALAAARAAAATLRPHPAVIGSSLGGYLALRYALEHGAAAVVALAPALDFPIAWDRWATAAELAEWERDGWREVDHHETGRKERLHHGIREDARRHPVVDRPPSCPVLVFQGKRDDVVPPALAERFAAGNRGVVLRLLDDDHSLLASIPRILEESTRFLAGVGRG